MAGYEHNLPHFDPDAFLRKYGSASGRISRYPENSVVYRQGEPADSIFYVKNGKVRLSILSKAGKEAVIEIIDAGNIFGEHCLAGYLTRISNAIALTKSTLAQIKREFVLTEMREDTNFSEYLMAAVVKENLKLRQHLADQMFNTSEKQLARALLMLANYTTDDNVSFRIPKVSQDMLATMVGTTRTRVNYYMNKFRRLGLIDYNGGIEVKSSLMDIVLHDAPSRG